MYYKYLYNSPLGELELISDEEQLIGLYIGKETESLYKVLDEKEDLPILKATCFWLDEYFAGKKPSLSTLKLSPEGGLFRQEVWKILLEVPYGKLLTYGEIAKEVAKRMGKERMSAQAVGGAVGHNPIMIIIPCHRVVGAYGNLTGFGGGIDLKIKLLKHEGVDLSRLYIPKKGTKL